MGDAEELNHEFSKVSTERVWKQLLVPAADEEARRKAAEAEKAELSAESPAVSEESVSESAEIKEAKGKILLLLLQIYYLDD